VKHAVEESEKERDYCVVLHQIQEHNVMRNVIFPMVIHLYDFIVHRRVSMEPFNNNTNKCDCSPGFEGYCCEKGKYICNMVGFIPLDLYTFFQ
jgi:hypothetical protein